MELSRFKPITFSFIVSLSIAFTFLMVTFCIFVYSGPHTIKDALNTTGSYFGAAATLGASFIAAYLLNDWREEVDFQSAKDFAFPILELLVSIRFELRWLLEILINLRHVENFAL